MAGEVFGRAVLLGAEHRFLGGELGHARHARRAEIDDPYGAGGINQDVLRPQVLVHHLAPVKGLQAPRDLLDKAAHGLEVRRGIVPHPLRQRASLNILHRRVEVAAPPRLRLGLQHVRAVDAPGDPLLHDQPAQLRGVVARFRRGHLEGDGRAGLGIQREIDVAAVARVERAQHPVAVEIGRWIEQGRGRQIRDAAR